MGQGPDFKNTTERGKGEPRQRQVDLIIQKLQEAHEQGLLYFGGTYGNTDEFGEPDPSGLSINVAIAPKTPIYTADGLNAFMGDVESYLSQVGKNDDSTSDRFSEIEYPDGRWTLRFGYLRYREPVAVKKRTEIEEYTPIEDGILDTLGLPEKRSRIREEQIDRVVTVKIFPHQTVAQDVADYKRSRLAYREGTQRNSNLSSLEYSMNQNDRAVLQGSGSSQRPGLPLPRRLLGGR